MNKNLTHEVVALDRHKVNEAIFVVSGVMFGVGVVTTLLFLDLSGVIVH